MKQKVKLSMALFASLALVNALDGAGGKKSDPSDADQVLLRMLNLSVVNNITVWRELEQGNIETAKTALVCRLEYSLPMDCSRMWMDCGRIWTSTLGNW